MEGRPRGSRFEPYRILESLGEGGTGEVTLAVDETLDRKVALETILAEQHASSTSAWRAHRSRPARRRVRRA